MNKGIPYLKRMPMMLTFVVALLALEVKWLFYMPIRWWLALSTGWRMMGCGPDLHTIAEALRQMKQQREEMK